MEKTPCLGCDSGRGFRVILEDIGPQCMNCGRRKPTEWDLYWEDCAASQMVYVGDTP